MRPSPYLHRIALDAVGRMRRVKIGMRWFSFGRWVISSPGALWILTA